MTGFPETCRITTAIIFPTSRKPELVPGICGRAETRCVREGSPENARGNPRFWRLTEKKLWLVSKIADLPIDVAMLRYVTSTPRAQRFQKLGAINDPGCKAAAKPDAYGLNLDDCSDPYSSGIMGIRLFPNPDFNPAVWNANKFLNFDPRIEPPYLAGLTCGVCHISFNPTKPPADPENPQWENLAPAIGNQYLHEGEMFKGRLTQKNFVYWVFDTQQPGTSDTSRISTDFINNPNAINSIWYILSARPKHAEIMNDGTTQEVPHILKDGSDSIGPAGAALRVYVNIGTCPDYRMSLEDTFMGILRPLPLGSDAKNPTVQHPFDLNKAQQDCVDWQLTAARMTNAANFLDANQPYYLKDAPGGTTYMTSDPAVLDLGKTVFGEQCARCHSSKLPPEVTQGGLDKHSPQATAAWVKLVKTPDFLDKNFLSDDDRYPLVSSDPRMAIGTNSNRALGTNPDTGHLWQNFSSVTFKQLPSPGPLVLENPFDVTKKITYQIPQGGGGYYRTPSLINVWATAPFFHNNMLGKFTGDPSVKGRMDAYQDAAEKLLWPEKRTGPRHHESDGDRFCSERGSDHDSHSGRNSGGSVGQYQRLCSGAARPVAGNAETVERTSGVAGASGAGVEEPRPIRPATRIISAVAAGSEPIARFHPGSRTHLWRRVAGRSEAGADRVHEDVLAEVGLRLRIKTSSFSR